MKPSVKVALVSVLISISLALIMLYLNLNTLWFSSSNFIHIFLLLTSIAVGLFLTKKVTAFAQLHFLEDIKIAMQGGMMYVIFMGFFIYYYHSSLDTSIVDTKRLEWIQSIEENVPNEQVYLELQEKDPTWRGKSYLDYIENQHDSVYAFISAKSIAIANVVAGLFLTLFFSIFSVLILRKAVLR
ncbi:MAG TPA: hypothetical protein EYG85_01390 [Crocinitomix sp.]|nr:hypothetical protein [Crocinitomix sp.]